MLGITIVAIAIAFIWYYLIRPLNYWKRIGVKQSKPWILLGDSWRTILGLYGLNDLVNIIYNLYPEARYTGFYNFTTPILAIKDPELIKQIAVKDFDYFSDHASLVDPEADPVWGNTLVALEGEQWKQLRTTLSPAFTSSKLKSIYPLMLEIAENFVKYYSEKRNEIIKVNLKDALSRYTNDVIATTAFGVKVNSLKDKDNTFHKMGKKLTTLNPITFLSNQGFPKLSKFLGFTLLNKEASKYFSTVINDTIKKREEGNIVRPDMIQLMLEARNDNSNNETALNFNDTGKPKTTIKLSNNDMICQGIIFYFGGFDTISNTMCFSAYELAVNKDIQDRLRKEILKTQKDGKVNYDELMQMKYMDMIVSEVLRKWPPFSFVNRRCTKPYTIKSSNKDETSLHISLGQEIWLPIYGLHRDPKYFPNPDKFNPERFSDENKSNIVPYSYIPFGAGPRSCIGNRLALLEVKALLFNLVLNYEIVPTEKTPVPLVLKGVSFFPKDGSYLGLKPIKS